MVGQARVDNARLKVLFLYRPPFEYAHSREIILLLLNVCNSPGSAFYTSVRRERERERARESEQLSNNNNSKCADSNQSRETASFKYLKIPIGILQLEIDHMGNIILELFS